MRLFDESSLRRALRHSGIVLAAALLPAAAQAQQRTFDLEPSYVLDAIPEFARQAGVQILAPAANLQGVRSPAIKGRMDVREALAKLLEHTKLEIALFNGETFVLRDAAPPPRFAAKPAPERRAAVSRLPRARGPAPPAARPSIDIDEIVVTGSRVVRNGYEAPTPVTVAGTGEIRSAGTINIADFVNTLPSLAGSATPGNSQKSTSSGTAGINALNLRGLGTMRTLVLLDGQRSVPTTVTGLVDVNNFPQELVSRIDVVTGGASAAYGSDALSGVVNFVLDKTYTGVKGEVSGGITTYGDNASGKASLTGGAPFGSERGHVLVSAEIFHVQGILNSPRKWNQEGWKIFDNPNYTPANGLPRLIVRSQTGLGVATPGGIITDTALRGIDFGPGGTPRQYNYGTLVSDPYQVGGDWKSSNTDFNSSLEGRMNHQSVFTRVSYDITDDVNAYVQASWGYTFAQNFNAKQYNIANLTVRSGNPFIPADVQARMTALGLFSFTLGTTNADLERISQMNGRTVNRYVAGASGQFGALGADWDWDAYYQKGIGRSSERVSTTQRSAYAAAIDAVRDPLTGAIVCRVALTDPRTPCVPYNLMGIGVNSASAIDYISRNAYRYQRFNQDVAAVTVQGEPFSVWAGPVSLALGVERRREAVTGLSSAIDQAQDLFVGNFLPNIGKFTVTEGFFETVIPLASGNAIGKLLDLNVALRATDYSVSGYVTTWKVGATYQPIDDVRFRVTRSRDIRAPNLAELFQSGTTNIRNIRDPFNNGAATQAYFTTTGNLDLVPEKADTTGLGVVFQPSFVSGFQASADYYSIHINNAIGSLSAQTLVDLCYLGNQTFCGVITRGVSNGVNVISSIINHPFNYVTQQARGLDLEMGYRFSLDKLNDDWTGGVALRLLATRYLRNFTNSGIPDDDPTDTVGDHGGSGPPKWRYVGSIGYAADPLNLTLTARGISSGYRDTSFIECTSACPASTINHQTIDNNRVAGALYWDLGAAYKIKSEGGLDAEVFLNIKNLANTDPATVAYGNSGTDFTRGPWNPTLYDTLGRVFRTGVRISM
ncbi:MAG: TonB-dependent receptor [Rhodospirillaceae bacterium]